MVQQNIETVIMGNNSETIECIDKRLAGLQEQLVKCVSGNKKYEMIADEIDALREKRQALTNQEAEQSALKQRIEEMREFLQTQTSRVTEYDEQLVRRLIEKITVYSDRFEFVFKSGMSIDLKR